ncbi:bi-domain-containing oxidoreductase [Nitrospira moscoviensis]|uniref:Putative Oxidoreductase, alcohol dehydrogenase-like protein n=1 Tax=Nitrospira moscoviensis TaxID=42253 RepID=A0A0K2GJV8_NITMO|nr:bi-domain-containing oxidoreductase [Nitrospira moscoviensis]ALA61139.1 putative Oxidoreductase, alcohol dehydrogenase-like protein [Nitrospira moscoviensis]
MKQVIQNFRTGVLKVESVPAPVVSAGQVLVANRFSLISPGTERSTVQVAQKTLLGKALERPEMAKKVFAAVQKDGLLATMRRVSDRLEHPAALGYSCAGVVLEVGRGIAGLAAGDRVACAGQNYASHAEIVSVPKHLCAKVPDGVSFEDASFVTLGAIALQGLRQLEPRLGERVAVIGLGLLGQLTVQLLKASGCRVLGSDLDRSRQELAAELGADCTTGPADLSAAAEAFSEGRGVDGVIITASTKSDLPVEAAGHIARQKGRVVVVGAVGMTLPREPYYRKELEVRLSMSYGPGRYDRSYEEEGRDYPFGYVRWTEQRNMEAFLDVLAQKKINVARLVTDRHPIDQAETAYERLAQSSSACLGMLISYPTAAGRSGPSVLPLKGARPAGPVRMGIIGAGQHARDMLLPSLSRLPDVTIAAVCTGSGITAKRMGEKLQAASCTTDFRAVLRDDAVNAVLIATRHNTHAEIVCEALRAGKHVFVEKPLCLTEQELDLIAEQYTGSAATGLQLWVGFNRRYSSHGAKVIDFFRDRRNPLVMVYRVNAGAISPTHWIQDPQVGGGRIVGEVCHFVDFMQAVCGARPISVHAVRIGSHTSGMAEDQCMLSLTFKDGSIGTVIYTAGGDTALPKERFEAFGDGKAVTLDDFALTEFYSHGKRTRHKTGVRDKGFDREMRGFTQAVAQGGAPSMQFEDIYAVTRACLLAAAGLKTGAVYDV